MKTRGPVAAVVLAGAILLQLALLGLFVRIDGGGVCLLPRYAGVPCPTCGMTRSVVLTLRGDAGAAFRLNPAGPLWVATALTVSAGLLYLAWRPGERTKRRVLLMALVQGLAVAVVLAGHWVRVVFAR